MIITLSADKKSVVSNRLIIKDGAKEEIERLHSLYLNPDFEFGYLQHGAIRFHQEKPKEILITKDNIQVFNSYQWGENGVNGVYPVEYLTTRAQNTSIIIRQILGLEHDYNFELKNFFADSSKEVHPNGAFVTKPFDLSMQLKKLKYILDNKEIALSLLKDAYFDLYLFVDLLTKVDLEIQGINEHDLFEGFYTEALENTQILDAAKEFAKLKK